MSLQVRGMQQLIDHFDKVGDVKSTKKAIKEASLVILDKEKQVARRKHRKYATGKGINALKALPPRGRGGRFYSKIGIKGGKDNWKDAKGLYYNHYGFWHNGYSSYGTRKNREKGNFNSGLYVAGSGWMDIAYDESIDDAYNKVEEILMQELKKIGVK